MRSYLHDIVGNDALCRRIGEDIARGTLSHAYIIEGEQGSGKHTMARAIAMALACENIEEQLADAEAQGVRLIDKTPRKGAEGLTIAFLHPKSTQGILTELCEDKNK